MARAAGSPSEPGTPSKLAKSPRAGAAAGGGVAAALARELADVKKRFLAVAKKKQAEYAKKVRCAWCPQAFPPTCHRACFHAQLP